ncbi:MAG: serine--tRNA ligase [Candidatus Marinimicrobia bacterium]|nr:serine--tRNA ligase [Candidatus Neomarinimicrobiota bacterium]
MIPISAIRENLKKIQESWKAKGEEFDVNKILILDKKHRDNLNQLNELRAERNIASEAIGKARRSGDNATEAIRKMKQVSKHIKELEKITADLDAQLKNILINLPNIPHGSVPVGADETMNVEIRDWGEKPNFGFTPKSHLELGTQLGMFDFQRGAKISGSGFPLYMNAGARLERALINFMLDHHHSEYGYTEVFPPFVANKSAMTTTGQLPKFAEDMYWSQTDELYLIPTAEVPVTNIHRDEILPEDDLPKYYSAYSACFRREAGSYGKDTRGFLRLHQFNKVELVKFVTPESSYDELESLTAQAESILQVLGLHYRVVELCTGDLSFASAKCYDLEVWAPGEKKWLEVSSCSNFESFQARRGNIRYRRNSDNKVDFVHTLNGSGVATPRLLVALLETYQNADGSILIPEPLQPYLGLKEIR